MFKINGGALSPALSSVWAIVLIVKKSTTIITFIFIYTYFSASGFLIQGYGKNKGCYGPNINFSNEVINSLPLKFL